MKNTILITACLAFLFLFFNRNVSAQTISSNSCELNDSTSLQEIEEFAIEIALGYMLYLEDHPYHDSLLVPRTFIDSISRYLYAYDNAMMYSDSLEDYKEYYFQRMEGCGLYLVLDSSAVAFNNENLILTNDTLIHILDSLNYNYYFNTNTWRNELSLSAYNANINHYGDFSFINDLACVQKIDFECAYADQAPCAKYRSARFMENGLEVFLYDYNDARYCGGESYSRRYKYLVFDDCSIEILGYRTHKENTPNNSSIKVFPNPVQNKLYLSNYQEWKTIKLITMQGQIALSINRPKQDQIDVSGIQPGLYVVEATTISGRVIIQKIEKR